MKINLIVLLIVLSNILFAQSSDSIKARAIFDWITDNIEYDIEAYQNNKVSLVQCDVENVLKTKKAVCEGYARLFQKMAQDSGLECKVITGKAKTFGFGDHAWNAVKIDSVWRLVDACWGAGGYRGNRFIKSKNLFYFFTPPEKLILTHFPDFQEYQFLKNPVTRQEFFGSENTGYSPVMYTLLLAEVSDYSYAEMIAMNVVTGYGRAVITYDPATKKYLVYSGQFTSEKEAIEASKTVENCSVKKLVK